MKDKKVEIVKDRLSKAERELVFRMRMQLPMNNTLEVLAYLRRALKLNGGTDAR